MNASALLTSQGWLGPGHALDARLTDYGAQTYKQKGHRGLAYDPHTQKSSSSSDPNNGFGQLATGNGLIRPLLVSQRHGSKYGIGKKSHEPASGNEWWLKGFASALANIGKSESERSSAVSSGTSTPRNGVMANGYVGKHSGLYNYFTSGTVMKGTIEPPSTDSSNSSLPEENDRITPTTNSRKSKKRKSDVLEEEDTSNSHNILSISPVRKAQTTKDLESSIPYLTERDKSRKKSHKHNKTNSDLEAFAVIGAFLGSTDVSGKQKGSHCGHLATGNEHDADTTRQETTDQERKARRRRRKEEKERERERITNSGTTATATTKKKQTLAEMVEEELAKLSSMDNSECERENDSNGPSNDERIQRRSKAKKKKGRDK